MQESQTEPAPSSEAAVERIEGRLGVRRKLLLGFLVAVLLLVPLDTVNSTPVRSVASAHLFSLVQWEVTNFPRKWVHLALDKLVGRRISREERLALLDEYLQLSRLAQKEIDRLEGLHLRRSAALAVGGSGREGPASEEYLKGLLKTKQQLVGRAEEAFESEVSAVIKAEGLGSGIGLIFPPVDIRFDRPPTILITSRRDRIELEEAVLLQPELRGLERDRLEKEMLKDHNLSALVDNLAGLGTYPSLVSDLSTFRAALQTAAHEWLHAYLFFRPLGWNMWKSEEMLTLNETAADLAGRELGDMAFASTGGDLSVSSRRYLPTEERDPVLTGEMRATRVRVEELLAEGRVAEAEQHMKEQWWRLRLGGYRLRKLNQAYFAFRGRYAESAASISPLGDQIREVRDLLPSVGEFIRTMSGVSSHQAFLGLLEQLRLQDSAAALEGQAAP